MKRREFLRLGTVAGVSTLLGRCSSDLRSPSASDRPPDILLIVGDDHARQALGAYGGIFASLSPTPHLDRLASEGMLFERCYAGSAICAPSRTTILTGLHAHKHGVTRNDLPFDRKIMTFPRLLRRSGYRTALFGKWHLQSKPAGFDHWEVLPGQGSYYGPDFRSPDGVQREEGYVTDRITDKALRWLEAGKRRSEPSLLLVHQKAAHAGWCPAPRHLGLYDGATIPEPASLFEDLSARGFAARNNEMSLFEDLKWSKHLKVPSLDSAEWRVLAYEENVLDRMDGAARDAWQRHYGAANLDVVRGALKGRELDRWKYRRFVTDYLSCVRSLDESVGRLLEALDRSGRAENTVVIYTSDQGFFLGEHGWFDKRFIYEPSAGMPLIVRWPGHVAAGQRSAALVSNLDLAQTILDLAGVEAPESMQGRSLQPLLRREFAASWRRSLYYHYHEFPAVMQVRRHEGVIAHRWKYVNFYEVLEQELYDLEADPLEMHNLIGEPGMERVEEELKAELFRLRLQYEEPRSAVPQLRVSR